MSALASIINAPTLGSTATKLSLGTPLTASLASYLPNLTGDALEDAVAAELTTLRALYDAKLWPIGMTDSQRVTDLAAPGTEGASYSVARPVERQAMNRRYTALVKLATDYLASANGSDGSDS